MGCLYKLTFPSGKSYIGITTGSAEKRLAGHRRAAAKIARPLYDAWRKHGEPAMVVLAMLNRDDLPAAEVRAIKAFGTMIPSGYNVTEGGEVSPMTIASAVKKMAATNTGRKLSCAHRAAIGSGNKGGKRTAEQRARMSAAAKLRGVTEETRRKMDAAKVGGKHSDEHKAKISAALLLRGARRAAV